MSESPNMAGDAKDQRYQAFLCFMDNDYVQCIEHLDHPQQLDEPGDSKPEIKEQRRLLAEGLSKKKDE